MPTGSLGTFDNPLEQLHVERVVFEERDSDPPNPDVGDFWFRYDLTPETDQVGELRWYDGTVQSFPVFATGSSASGVEEVIRLQTVNGRGYVPIASPSEAAYSQLPFQHAGSTYGLHNDTEPGAPRPNSVVSRTDDNQSQSQSAKIGLQIESTVEWPEIGVRISANTAGVQSVYIHQASDGALIADKSVSNLGGGDTTTLTANLSANTKYNVVVDADGSNYTDGYYDSPSYPITSGDGQLTIVTGATGETSTNPDAHTIVEVGDVGFN